MIKLTGQQCKCARALLKWNISDLANHVNGIKPRRIEGFERGNVHLLVWENDELVSEFKKAGIVFRADLEVALKEDEVEHPDEGGTKQGDGARIVLDAEQNVLSDSSASAVPLAASKQILREEEAISKKE